MACWENGPMGALLALHLRIGGRCTWRDIVAPTTCVCVGRGLLSK